MLVDDKLAKEKLAREIEFRPDVEPFGMIAHEQRRIAQLIRNTDLTDCQQVSLAEIPACDCYCSPHLRNCATQVAAPDQGSVRNATDIAMAQGFTGHADTWQAREAMAPIECVG